MSIESAREDLMYRLEQLVGAVNSDYDEDGRDLIDRIEEDLDDAEFYIQRCKDALDEYEEALNESEED